MTKRDEIIAISEYYNIPMRVAALKHSTMMENELEEIISWWLSKIDERG